MIRTAFIAWLSLTGAVATAEPIPKVKPVVPNYGLVLRDGMKCVYSYKSIGNIVLDDIETTVECKKLKADDTGTYFEQTKYQNTQNAQTITEHFFVANDASVFLLKDGKKMRWPNLANQKAGAIVKRPYPVGAGIFELELTIEAVEDEIEIEGKTFKALKYSQTKTIKGGDLNCTTWCTDHKGPGMIRIVSKQVGFDLIVTLKDYTPGK